MGIKSIDQLSFKSKFNILLFAIVFVCLFTGSCSIYMYYQTDYIKMAIHDTKDMQIKFLEIRRNEKNFFARETKNPDYFKTKKISIN